MLVFAQRIEDVVRLRRENITVTAELVTVRLSALDIALPPPLDQPLRDLLADPQHTRTAAHPDSPWLFRGGSPGRHLTASHLRQRLTQICSARAARLGTLQELTRTAPVAVIAEVLGYAPATVEKHALAAASTYAQYVAAPRRPTP